MGGYRLTYLDDAGYPAANLLETKVLLNSTILDTTKWARFTTVYIQIYFLFTPMARLEFMKVHYKHILEDIRAQYKLHDKLSSQDDIYIRINKGMYDLKQAAILAYENLKQSLAPHSYTFIIDTVGISGHKTRLTTFCLCVDDFGIKYFNKLDAHHLLDAICQIYKYKNIQPNGKEQNIADLHWTDTIQMDI